ncbi:2-hydroxyacyl-CoA lyase 2 isoform X2 [Parasteatoda tepidariorum]|uniref:2-hydroxyacyl-CoA lyase 2 isoform X2 n=1 Tax=Parasteatoda tepidariorum TaxID=114398 RepID=UPI001C725221|nr:2-hydroxyacyl-CoA lyase 2 isoform X2 [Parasteatoda tepidariorum]
MHLLFSRCRLLRNSQLSVLRNFQNRQYFKVDIESENHGGTLVAQVLKSHGVSHIFTLIGGHISPILIAAEKLGIKVIDTRHEVTCVFAADAFSRLSGKMGVAAVTAGPGVTNTITALKNAQMAETPLLLLGGAAATLLKGRGALQDIDQISLVKSICKYHKSVTSLRQIVPVLREAMKEAVSNTPGPVFVELPLNVLYPYKVVMQEMQIKENPKGFVQNITSMFLKTYLRYQFAGAFDEQDTSPLPVSYPKASDNDINKCMELIAKSERPLILLGSQAMIPPTLSTSLKESLEHLNIPCFLGGMSRGLLGHKGNLHMRQKRREALKEADLVILAGTVCDFRLSYGRVLSSKSKIISVNRDAQQLKKNSGVFWNPDIAIQGSAPEFLIKLASKYSWGSAQNSWISKLRERDEATERQNEEKIVQSDSKYLDPIYLINQLEEVLPDNTILVADGGDFVATASYILRPRGPLKWLDPGAFGTLGVGAGFALGAKACNPDSNVVILYGDGSCGYSIVEYDTFARHKLPIAAIVGNDACWTQIAREQVPRFKSDVACNLSYTDYHKVVEPFGAKGFLLSGENKSTIKDTIKTALQLTEKGQSVLINVLIGKTNFRDGSISV